jgi:hypothetical protein
MEGIGLGRQGPPERLEPLASACLSAAATGYRPGVRAAPVNLLDRRFMVGAP